MAFVIFCWHRGQLCLQPHLGLPGFVQHMCAPCALIAVITVSLENTTFSYWYLNYLGQPVSAVLSSPGIACYGLPVNAVKCAVFFFIQLLQKAAIKCKTLTCEN